MTMKMTRSVYWSQFLAAAEPGEDLLDDSVHSTRFETTGLSVFRKSVEKEQRF